MAIALEDSAEFASWCGCKNSSLCQSIVERVLEEEDSLTLRDILIFLQCPNCDHWESNIY